MNLAEKISAWTEGNYDEAELVAAIEAGAEDATNHRNSFGTVVEGLTPEQQERCAPLIDFAFSSLDILDHELQEVLDGLEAADQDKVITAGDMIVRASFQLNQAFAEFRNQALAALGPTDIPNFNHLVSMREAYVADPNEDTLRNFQESIDVERATALQGARDLVKDNQIPEVVSLTNSFMSHLGGLNRLTEDLTANGAATDFDAHFVSIEMSFRELKELLPMTQVALRAQGETEFPDLNYLLSMIKEAEAGTMGDGPVVEALQAVEAGFLESYEKFQQALPAMESALVKEEIEGAIASFEDFREGVQAMYRFLLERERIRLSQARGYFLDFATRLTQHKERLKELEAMEGKVTCPRCATVNEHDRQRCSSCGFSLPQNVGVTTTSTFQAKEAGGISNEPEEELLLTTNLVRLYEAVNAVHAGTISDEAFVAEIDKFETLVNGSINTLPAEPTLSDPLQQSTVNVVYDAFEEGVELFRQGADLFRSYLQSRDEDSLKQGILVIDQGAKKIDAAGKAVSAAPAP